MVLTVEESSSGETPFWEAMLGRDSRMDGLFFYGVASTGVYCRPSCPSRRPRRANVVFFSNRELAERAGFRPCLRCRPDKLGTNPHAELVSSVCRHIESNLDGPLTLGVLGRRLGVSPFSLQRTFKSMTGITPRAYADARRLEAMKAGLRRGESVTRAMVDAGYSSSSRLYERSGAQLGMAPLQYRSGAPGIMIRYAVTDSPLGKLLVAGTEVGVCAIQFGESRAVLEKTIRAEYTRAHLEYDPQSLEPWVRRVLDQLGGGQVQSDLPLDIRATAFQRLVWEHLRSIPRGRTESYSEVARNVGRPRAARAVARACASNPVALAIPCHRVVRGDGEPGGYRWGIRRKKLLLEMELRNRGGPQEG